MTKTTISKSIEIDYGHSLPNHFSFCNQIHGHRAKLTIFVYGDVSMISGDSSEGMVMDFAILKDILKKQIHEVLDHGFAIWKDDPLLEVIKKRNKKILITDNPPTSEILAKWVFYKIEKLLPKDIMLKEVRWQETSNSMAIYSG